MALICESGQFTAPATNQEQTVTLNNFTGVTPKVVILSWSRVLANGISTECALGTGVGISSTEEGSVYFVARNNQATTITASSKGVHCFRDVDNDGAEQTQASFTSFGDNQFTITWDGASAPVSQLVNYFVIGGDDLTDVSLLEFATPVTTGNEAYTGVGFQPDAIFFLNSVLTNEGDTGVAGGYIGYGATDGVNQAALGVSTLDNVAASLVNQLQLTSACIALPHNNGTLYQASIVSLDSDGFTVNYSVVNAAARRCFALCLKGGQYHVGSGDSQTTAGTQGYTGTGFTPVGALFFNAASAASASVLQDLHVNFGSSSGATQNTCSLGTDEDAQDTSDCDRAMSITKCVKMIDHAQAVIAEADLDSFDSDGFTFDWTTADATARQFLYLAMGSEEAVVAVDEDDDLIIGGGLFNEFMI